MWLTRGSQLHQFSIIDIFSLRLDDFAKNRSDTKNAGFMPEVVGGCVEKMSYPVAIGIPKVR